MKRKRVKYLIIGAGPCGLGAAYRLKELGEKDFLIVEKNSYPGGLAASFKDNQGFVWDIGGHVQFSHYKYFDDLMDLALGEDGWLNHKRVSAVWMLNRFIPYPLQHNLYYLPFKYKAKILYEIASLNYLNNLSCPSNFKEWLLNTFGKTLSSLFLFPYNFKVWATPLDKMSYSWIGERVATVNFKEIFLKTLFKRDSTTWGPNSFFRFPKEGGTGAIWKAVAKLVGNDFILYNNAVVSIDNEKRVIKTESGITIEYDYLLSTMPLNYLISLLSFKNREIAELTNQLFFTNSHIVGIGVKGNPPVQIKDKCWMYFPEDNCPFYRVTLFSKYSPNNVPDINKYYSLMAETAQSTFKDVSEKNITLQTIEGLKNVGLINKGAKVVSQWHFLASYGYPVPTLKRDDILSSTIPWLENFNIYSRGRFGGWKYEVSNQDHTTMQGVEWANYIVLNEKERTFTV